ncbi:hypothetical protein [Vreelandella piezotolerans]|uniref:hypothetical protein n=1 Tax=Vreelandella piezotolerans TaxID=2609667 RepID=UPI0037AFB299
MSKDNFYTPRASRVEVHEVHSNLTAEVIEITSEKLELILREHLDCLAKENEWHAPLGILVTIILVILTTSFKQAFGLSADTWSAIFVICAALSAFWLLKAIRVRRKSLSVNELLNKVKNRS